jgi:chromosome partitioning protein
MTGHHHPTTTTTTTTRRNPMVTTIAQQKGGVGKTTTAINIGVLLARDGRRALLIDTDPQAALTRQLGIPPGAGPTLVDVLTGTTNAATAIRHGLHGVDVLSAGPALAGVEMSLVAEMGRERFLREALDELIGSYDEIVIDTPPNLGLLTVNALVCADRVIAPVSAEDEGAVHGILELRSTIQRLTQRLGVPEPALIPVITRWMPFRLSSRSIDRALNDACLRSVGRIPSRSAAVARAAHERTPLAVSAPDHPVSLAYRRIVEQFAEVIAR